MSEVNVHVGYDAKATKSRVLDAIRQAERGQIIGEAHITFESWEGLARVLTGKRLELLRHLHGQPAASIADLARRLGRDYKRVHEDVDVLTAAGLIERSDAGEIRDAYDKISASINLTRPGA